MTFPNAVNDCGQDQPSIEACKAGTGVACSGYVMVNGTRLYFEDTGGSGEPIIFSHALLLDSTLFAPQVELLRKKYRCISYHHRGQGLSAEHESDSIDLDLLCEDVAALINKLQLGSVHFCGLSMGGFVGLRLAVKYPELVKSLILCSTSAEPEPPENMLRYRLLNFIGRVLGPASVARLLVPIIFGKTTINDPAHKGSKDRLIRQLSKNRRSIWRAVNGVIYRKGVVEQLHRIHVPSLIVVGEEDLCTMPDKSELLGRMLPDGRLVKVPRGGHAITLEQPAVVTELMEGFLAAIPSARYSSK